MIRHTLAILWKQMKDTLKNKEILIQFVMFPILTVVMERFVEFPMDLTGMPEHFFAGLFSAMYVGMAPLTSMAAIIAEEKEKNTLRVMLLSNVKPIAFLLGVGIYIWTICMAGAVLIGVGAGFAAGEFVQFMAVMAGGIAVSVMIGAVIGVASKNQMAATSVTVPVMLVFSFLPMLSMFNEAISKVSRFIYSGQLHNLMGKVGAIGFEWEWFGVILGNFAVAAVLFWGTYRRKGLE